MMNGNLLLVEDDPALADLLKWHFEREDFNVAHTPDGDEALLLAAETPPDIILLDWMIEGISGLEVCRRVRRAPETANVPNARPAAALELCSGPVTYRGRV